MSERKKEEEKTKGSCSAKPETHDSMMNEGNLSVKKASLSYSSISEIHSALVRNAYSPRELFEYLQDNYIQWSESEKIQEPENSIELIRGSEDDYHNLSVEFSRHDCEPFAATTAMIGVSIYPMSVDLISDLVKYSQMIGDTEMCQHGIDRLKTIERQYWTWRTFVFAIDYYKDSLGSVKDIDTYKNNINEAEKLIADFKKYIPHEERAYVAEAELKQNQNDYKAALTALLTGVRKVAVAPQCCMKLADYYLELGKYDEVEKYARKGILTSIQDQPTISVGYLYYILALSLDAKRIIAHREGKLMGNGEIIAIMTAYQTADKLLVNEGRVNVAYRNTIQARKIMLEMEEGLAKETDSSGQGSKEELERLFELLSKKDVRENTID